MLPIAQIANLGRTLLCYEFSTLYNETTSTLPFYISKVTMATPGQNISIPVGPGTKSKQTFHVDVVHIPS
jgi:hypothetical protein